MTARLQVLLLAAGASRRFGSAKQLAPIHGVPMVRHTAFQLISLPGARVTVIIGSRAPAVAAALRGLPLRIVVNRAWALGLGSSLRAGMRLMPPGVGAVLILLADQVEVHRWHLLQLIRRWRAQPKRIAAARYGGVFGAPAIFPSAYFAALRRIRGDEGARSLLRSPGMKLSSVPMDSAARDLDEPAVELRSELSAARGAEKN